MKRIINFSFAVLLTGLMSSCVSMTSVSASNVKPSTGTEVKASAGGFGVLSLTVPRGVAKKATDELKSKGAVTNVTTVLTVRNWGIVQFYRVTATGTIE
jgi:hypothetical protein